MSTTILQQCVRIVIISLTQKIKSPQQKMGNSSNQSQWDIKFVQNLEDPHYGCIDIYKNQQGKYIMMLRRTFMRNDRNGGYNDKGFHEILAYMDSSAEGKEQQFITPILHHISKVENLCVIYQIIDTYCEYFNFTLADMIKHKKEMDCEELWHCFHWLLKLVSLLHRRGWTLADGVKLEKIFLTLKGTPTISIHHMVKTSSIDQVVSKERNVLEEAALCVLQLACMTTINQHDNFQLFIRKTEKIDKNLGQLLGLILRKSISTKKKDQNQLLARVEALAQQGKITVSKEIKLNKFKYIIPKPEIKSQTNTEQSVSQSFNNKETKQSQKQKEKPVHINSLHGRKNRQHLSLRGSGKRQNQGIMDFVENKVPGLQTPMGATLNKTMTIKNSILIDQIQNRKKASQKQKQKMSQRKQLILNSVLPDKISSGGGSGMGTVSGLTSTKNKDKNKENILGNSIREVRPSYNRKQSWTKKIINDHLKQSYRS